MPETVTAELRLLGVTELRRDGVDVGAFLAGPKRLGLLAYLVLARPHGFHRRDTLLALFWPEHGEPSARNALSNMLHHVRRAVGKDALINRGAEAVGVRPERLWSDAAAFESAVAEGHHREALALYRGEVLAVFHIRAVAPEFVQWLDQERERLRGLAAASAWRLAEAAEGAGDLGGAQGWAQRAADLTPLSGAAQARLVSLLDRSGDRSGALLAFEAYAARLENEWGIAPSGEVAALASRLRSQAARGRPPLADAGPGARSIAVLPFEALGDTATAFADGIHGDLLTRLSAVSALDVISRTSVRRYRHTEQSTPEIGAELGAQWVVEGEAQESDGHVRVTVRLVDAALDRQAWARDYTSELTAGDLFAIQGRITTEIAASLQAELAPSEAAAVAFQPTSDLAAYRLCMQGRVFLDERTERGMRRALDSFERAVAQDPGYVLAWVGAADALALLHDYGYEEAAEVLPDAERAVRQALTLDPRSAEAYASLGGLHTIRHQGPLALTMLERAVELRPGYAEAHNWLSWVSLLLGRRRESLGHARRSVALNPLSPEAVSNLTLAYLVNGALDDALEEARRERELGSDWGTGAFYEGLALYEGGQFKEAAVALDGVEAPWAGCGPRATRALALVACGEADEARGLARDFSGDAFASGLVLAALGDVEGALVALHTVETWGHWPTLAVRHLYRRVWEPPGGGHPYRSLLPLVEADWNRMTADSPGPRTERTSASGPHSL